MEDMDWKSFENQLRAYIKKRAPLSDADDIYGDVILRLVKHKDKFQAADNPLAWMYRVTANVITDHYRKRSLEQKALKQAASDDTDVASGVASHESAPAELARCVIPFIKNLPAPYDEALYMTEIEGLTQAEAAKKHGLSLSGMKSRVQRGRAHLKQAILDCCQVQVNQRGNILDFEQNQSNCCN